MVSVYWIRHADHTDMFSQGYIGISKKPTQRWRHHLSQPTNLHMKNVIRKYGWGNLIKEVVLIGDSNYCLSIEKKLRPIDFIGWNATAGGGFPPKPKKGMGLGNKLSDETKKKIADFRNGRQHSPETKEKLRQAAIAQWARQRSTPLPPDA